MKRKLVPILLGLAVCSGNASQLTLSNTNLIVIGDDVSVPPIQGVPYPSTIQVSGVTGLVATRAVVTIQAFSHYFPSDVHLLLTAPDGRSAILMSEVGGQNKYSVTNLTITFDDAASTNLPINTRLQSGTYKPTARELPLSFNFPPPAPAGNSNSPCSLSVFRNMDPTGTWSLYAVDNGAGDSGAISNGWTLKLDISVPLQLAKQQSNVVLSWPATAQPCTLQSGTSPHGGAWSNVTNTPFPAVGRMFVTNPAAGSAGFFRLAQ